VRRIFKANVHVYQLIYVGKIHTLVAENVKQKKKNYKNCKEKILKKKSLLDIDCTEGNKLLYILLYILLCSLIFNSAFTT